MDRDKLKEKIIETLNEFRRELQKPNAVINSKTLVALQSNFAVQLEALIPDIEEAKREERERIIEILDIEYDEDGCPVSYPSQATLQALKSS